MSTGLNAWFCAVCKGLTIVKHRDPGVTPMFLGCRARGEGQCKGLASSLMYPHESFFSMLGLGRPRNRFGGPVDPRTPELKVEWEWIAETDDQRAGAECLTLRQVGG